VPTNKLLAAAICLLILWSESALSKTAPVILTKLNGPLYLVEDNNFNKTNSLVYIGTSSITVIGATWTPATAQLLHTEIKKVSSLPIGEVIDTSPDLEWVGGNDYWKSVGAKVVAANVTCELMPKKWVSPLPPSKNFPDYPDLPPSLPAECKPAPFSLQDGRVQVLFLGPSHTDGDVFVYFPEQKVLDAGSILKEQVGNLASANLDEYPKTLAKLKALHLDIRTVIAGHWSPVHGPELIDLYQGFLVKEKH
jgi:metallo-beta-lactamase class B